MKHQFNEDGLLDPQQLKIEINNYLEKNERFPILSSRFQSVVKDYILEKKIEDIAKELSITRERVRQIVYRCQLSIGILPPPPTFEDYINMFGLENLKNDVELFLQQETENWSPLSVQVMGVFIEYLKKREELD